MGKTGRFAARRDAWLAAWAVPEAPSDAPRDAAREPCHAKRLDPEGGEFLRGRAQHHCPGEEDRVLLGIIEPLARGDMSRASCEKAVAALRAALREQHGFAKPRVLEWA